jgi:type IX secretion system PorP/SprF family membrane protein
MKKKLLLSLILLTSLSVFSQQDAQFTQYMYNTININPAYAGSRGVLSVFGLYRTQWVGLDGAPQTSTFSLNTPINNSKFGLGVSVISDKIGPSDETTISADVSYSVKTSERYKLSFGVKGTANLLNIDLSKPSRYNNTDLLVNNVDNQFSPNVGAGIYWHSAESYLGFSIPNFLQTEHFKSATTVRSTSSVVEVAKERLHLHLIGGYVFDLSPSLKFKPAFLVKSVKGAPLQADLTANFMFNEKFVLGAAYRWSAAVSLLAGFQVDNNWFIGYGYDLETTPLSKYNGGSHEIFLRYELFNKTDNIISPRFF